MRSPEPAKRMFINLVNEVSKRNEYLYHNDYHNARLKACTADAIAECIKICHGNVFFGKNFKSPEYIESIQLSMDGKKIMIWEEERINEFVQNMA